MTGSFCLTRWLAGAKALVFDFDGTLVDSNPIKWRAFERCFKGFTDQREEIRAYCQGHPHIPRGEKFRYVFEEILRLPYTPKVERSLHRCFERETTDRILSAPEISGAESFLRMAHRRYGTAVLSSTPQGVLWDIVVRRGWGSYFHQVQGAPVEKAGWLSSLKGRWGLTQQALVFFGDTPEDADAALEAGCTFVAVGRDRLAKARFQVYDFTELCRRMAP